WMVLTTGNKSEMAVGYFTLYGDSVGGYAVIKDVFKLTVYELCHHVNRRAGREIIPHAIIEKPPSAELRPDQRNHRNLEGCWFTVTTDGTVNVEESVNVLRNATISNTL
ncbi:MAG: NAD(+) synthase, partial [Actinomycetota bacterium]